MNPGGFGAMLGSSLKRGIHQRVDSESPPWTKGDIFEATGVQMEPARHIKQMLGGIWAMHVSPSTRALHSEWLRLACVPVPQPCCHLCAPRHRRVRDLIKPRLRRVLE